MNPKPKKSKHDLKDLCAEFDRAMNTPPRYIGSTPMKALQRSVRTTPKPASKKKSKSGF